MAERTDSDSSRGWRGSLLPYVLAVVLLLGVGGAVAAVLILTRPEPGGRLDKRPARLVRVFAAEKASHRLAITAYGTSRAAEVWTAIAEVRGRAVEVNRRFEVGEVLPAGALLVRIDPTDYELARDRARADVEAKQLQIRELDQSEGDLIKIRKLQERQLDLAEHEYKRQYQLHHVEKVAPVSALEAAENAYVAQLTALQKTRNSLALVSVQRLQLEALLKTATVQLEQAGRDVGRCEIRSPLDARCASKSIEVDQFVTAGERLGTFLTLETAEVVAMAETHKVAALFREDGDEPTVLDLSEISHGESLWRRFQIPVAVSWALGGQSVVWRGRLSRIGSSLDPGTRTVPLIIEVRDPYRDIRPGIRPPLLPDVFCQVTAYGPTLDDVVVIPRETLHRMPRGSMDREAGERAGSDAAIDVVYLLEVEDARKDQGRLKRDAGEVPVLDGRLRIAEVKVSVLEENLAVISEGIEDGEMVILTDLFPASEQMPLRGRWLDPPVSRRTKIDFPESFFKDAEEPAVDRPTDEPGAARPGEAEGVPEVLR